MMTTEVDGQPRDEIADYIDMRSVGSSEAAWLLFSFPITGRYPAVKPLRVHLEEEQQIVFDENLEVEALENQRDTELTAFFNYNEANSNNPECWAKYVDMPKRHVYNQKKKEWHNRKQGNDTVIGRVHSVNPVAGEAFYLRILLHDNHCMGKTSFQDMLKLPCGRVCENYKEVCVELGLLSDDKEWEKILESAAVTQMCPQIRELFVIILVFCMPSNPLTLFESFWDTWCDDFVRKAESSGVHLTESQLRTMLLLDIEQRLSSFEKSLQSFMLPEPSDEDIIAVEHVNSIEPPFIREELDFDVGELKNLVEERVTTFTPEQANIFETVMDAVINERPVQIFIDARGGCGKTYLINTILAAVRSLEPGGCVALAMATTGIAGNLLTLGRTFHSRMKAPLKPTKDSTLNISSQSNLATLIRRAKLLLIDESTMLDRFLLEAMDRSLRDLMQAPEKPFGGKIIILAGDFRQCLPVVPGASRAGTVEHCINQSHLWSTFSLLTLTKNMRVDASGDLDLEQFDRWTLQIGNGEIDSLNLPSNLLATQIIPNSQKNKSSEGQAMKEFCQKVFPDLEANIVNSNFLDGRSILATTNKEVAMLNDIVIDLIPGNGSFLRSADELCHTEDLLRFSTEYLNSLSPTGFPPHCLRLKPGIPVLLLRNLNPRLGLCNGTKMIFERCIDNKLLQCKIIGSDR